MFMKFERASGVLLHPTSLPGKRGIGEIGPEAEKFADFLAETGQRLWQILPLGPTSYGDSPYQAMSTFAGNPLWIGLDWLAEDGLLTAEDLKEYPEFPEGRVDYGAVIPVRARFLKKACAAFRAGAKEELKEGYAAFCAANAAWLEDYALFIALKGENGGRPWTEWEAGVARREAGGRAAARERLAEAVEDEKIVQYLFARQWKRLRWHAGEKRVKFVGDIPIFVAHDSADVWARPDLFWLKEDGTPTVVAGVPPDYFSETGQLWGNPLYRWDVHKAEGYAWWVARLKRVLEMVDIVRIDHFRGFEAYWEVPGGAETAIGGRWVKGPGSDLFDAMKAQMGDLPIIAEDLGVITDEVEALRDHCGFPGMRILQFAFGNDERAAEFRPESYPAHCVVYTGTHDNDTTVGWFNSQAGAGSTRTAEEIAAERKEILDYLGTDGHEINWDLILLGSKSNANTFVTPMQDLLGLGTEARMNTPGAAGGNWQWRFEWHELTHATRSRLGHITRATGRAH